MFPTSQQPWAVGGSFEVAQALKTLAPDRLVPFLKNPRPSTPMEPSGTRQTPPTTHFREAAQALAELGPNGAFATRAARSVGGSR